jgi:putative oxidoreductase
MPQMARGMSVDCPEHQEVRDMTSLFSRESAVERTPEVGRMRGMALATMRVVVGSACLLVGFAMLDGTPTMVAMFEAIGGGQWSRYLIGTIDVLSAVVVFVPSLAAYGAFVLSLTLIGTLATRLFVSGGPLLLPLVLLVGSIAVVWSYRDQLLRRQA